MNSGKIVLLTLLFVLLTIPLGAQMSICSVATLKGTYGGHAEGTVLAQFPGFPPPPYPAVAAGLHSYDGAGNVSVTYGSSLGGVIIPWGVVATGTYTVTPDCKVSVALTDPMGSYHFVGMIMGQGMQQEVHLMYTDPFWVLSGMFRRTPRRGCSQASLRGKYLLFGQGLASIPNLPPLLPAAHVGIMTADGQGNLSGNDTLNIAGTVAPDTFTGTYTVNLDCTYSATITTGVGVLQEAGTITGEDQQQEIHTIFMESGWVVAESAQKQ